MLSPMSVMIRSAKHFIQHLLVKDPKKRYTAEAALSHPWIKVQQTRVDVLAEIHYNEIFFSSHDLYFSIRTFSQGQGFEELSSRSSFQLLTRENNRKGEKKDEKKK